MTDGSRLLRTSGAALLGLIAALAAAPSGAQTITGRLVDGGSGEPIASGAISLLTEPGDVVARAESDAAGRFSVRAAEPGSYYLRGEHIGYRAVTDGIFELGSGGRMEVEIRLSTRPVELEPLDVRIESDYLARRQRESLNRRGYYDRKKAGFGYFVEVDSLRLIPFNHSDLFRRMPGVSKFPGTAVSLRRCGRFAGWVNGIRVFQGSSWDMSLDVDIGSIAAVEVYPSVARLPLQWGGFGVCGAILVWTK